MIAVSLNVGGGVRLIKPAKLYMYTQTHYKYDEDGCTVPAVHGHGSVPLSHLGNVVTRIGLHTDNIKEWSGTDFTTQLRQLKTGLCVKGLW